MTTRPTNRILALLLALALPIPALARQTGGLPGQPGKGSLGPGQGPDQPLRDADGNTWAFWWFLNQERLIGLRTALVPQPDPVQGYRRVAAKDVDAAVAALVAALADASPTVRAAAVLALGKAGDPKATAALLAEPRAGMKPPLFDDNAIVRRNAILALGLSGDPAVLKTLIDLLGDKGLALDLRAVAALAIGLVDERTITPAASGNVEPPVVPAPDAEPETRPLAPAAKEGRRLPDVADVRAIAVPSDPQRVAFATADGRFELWPVKQDKLGRGFAKQPTPIAALAFDAAGERIASAGADGTARIWSQKTFKDQVRLDASTAPLRCVAFAPGGERVAAAGDDGRVYLLASSGKKEFDETLEAHGGAVDAIAFSGDGKTLYAACEDGSLRQLPARGGDSIAKVVELGSPVRALAADPTRGLLAAGLADGRVVLFSARSGPLAELGRFAGGEGAVIALALSPAGDRLASATASGGVRLLDLAGGAELLRVGATAACLAFVGPDQLAVGGADGIALIPLAGALAAHGLEPPEDPAPAHPVHPAPIPADPSLAVGGVLRELLAVERFKEFDPLVQNSLALAAGLRGDPGLAPSIRQLLALPRGKQGALNQSTIGALALALARVQATADTGDAELLWKLLVKDDFVQVRRAAAIGIGLVFQGKGGTAEGDARVLDILRRLEQRGADENDRSVKNNLYVALGRIGGPRAASYLESQLRGKDGNTFDIGFEELDEEPFQATALALTGASDGYKRIAIRFAKEGAAHFRSALAVSLGLYGKAQKSANDRLRQVLDKEKNPQLRAYVALALGLARDAEAVPALRRILQAESGDGGDADLLPYAAIALGLLRDPTAQVILVKRVASAPRDADASAVFALGQIGDSEAVLPLMSVLADKNRLPDVRAYAAQALGELLDPAALGKLARMRSDFDALSDPRLLDATGLLRLL